MHTEQKITFKQKNEFCLLPIFEHQILSMNKESWEKNHMDEVCENIQEWKLKSMHLIQIHPLILKKISSISFSNLKQIYFNGNKIQTIEGIDKMEMPTLEKFFFSIHGLIRLQQFVFSFKLKKSSLDCIIGFSFEYFSHNRDGNVINQLHPITNLFCSQLKTLFILFLKAERIQCFDLRVLLKIETKQLSTAYINDFTTIKEPTLRNVLRRKYNMIYIL